MMKAEYRIETKEDKDFGDSYGLFIKDKFIASTERVDSGYSVRWHSTKTLPSLAAALRLFYAGLQVDTVDTSDQKIFSVPGLYPIFNGSISAGVKIVVGDEDAEVYPIPKAYASLDDFMTNTEPVAAFFKRGYQSNIGSVRIATPYCDMFLEQYGKPIVLVTVMTDDRVNLTDALVKSIQTTTRFQRYANASYFSSALGELVGKAII